MERFDQREFNNFILDNNVIGFSEVPWVLSSGSKSYWYVNWRNAVGYAFLLDKLSDYIIAFTKDLELQPDCFYGVPEGSTQIATITQHKWAKQSHNYGPHSHIMTIGRGRPKDHGDPKDKYFVGKPRGDVIFLEDTTTTGRSLLSSIDYAKENTDIRIVASYTLTDRDQWGYARGKTIKSELESRGIPYYAMSHALDLLPEAYKRLKPGEHIARLVEQEFEEWGVNRLKLIG